MIVGNHGIIIVAIIFVILTITSMIWASAEYRHCKELERRSSVKCDWSSYN